MNIDSIKTQPAPAEAATVTQAPPSLERGQVLHATVMSIDGESVVLRSDQGVFRAVLQAESALLVGDRLEFMVTDAGEGHTGLHLVNVEHMTAGADRAALSEQTMLASLGLTGDRLANAVLSAMKALDIPPTQQSLQNAMTLMRENNMNLRDALFFALNNIPADSENVQAYQAMLRGETLGRGLWEATQTAATTPDTPPAQAANPEAPAGTPLPVAEIPLPGQPAPVDASAAAPIAPPDAWPTATPSPLPGTEAPVAQSDALPGEAPPPAAQAAPQSADTAPVAPPIDPEAQAPAAETEQAAPTTGEAPRLPLAEIATRLAALFSEIDGQLDGEKLKSGAQNLREILVLKETLQSADISGREALAAQVNNLASQTQLTQDISRFYCLHLPVQQRDDHATAEIYVYKQPRRGRVDADNTAIAIGLDTQNIGRVETYIRVEQRRISMAFKVENTDALAPFKERAKELYRPLSQQNYRLVDVKVSPLTGRITPANAQEVLTQAMSRPRTRGLDYKI